MGNIALSPCFQLPSSSSSSRTKKVKLVFWGGATQLLPKTQLAGELLFCYPDRIVCHADSFYIGRPVPALAIEDELLAGHTYFVLPVDCLPCQTLTTASLASLSASKEKQSFVGGGSGVKNSLPPFEYLKGKDGKTLIKVVPEFITRAISRSTTDTSCADLSSTSVDCGSTLCTTPELRKHYEQLVVSPNHRTWSPKLQTITEKKARLISTVAILSPSRLSPTRMFCLDTR